MHEHHSFIGRLGKILPAVIILAVAVGLSGYWLTNKPRAERQPSRVSAPLVTTMVAQVADHRVIISAMGNVVASQRIDLTSRVKGEVIRVSHAFIPGGKFRSGDEILKIDPRDYELIVQQKKSEQARAEYELKLEMGQQAIARQEYKLLGDTLEEKEQELVLRRPHLKSTKSALAAAEASLEQARLDLKRTKVVSPFNAVVLTRNVDLGSWVSSGSPLVTLVGTDRYWVEVAIPMDRVRWVEIPGVTGTGSSDARIMHEAAWGPDRFRTASVKRLMAEVEEEGRMAMLVIEVDDPLCLKDENRNSPPLILGAYVRVEIEGKNLSDVIRLPRSSLHDGDRVWTLTTEQTLDIRKVEIAWGEKDYVFVKADILKEGDEVITSELSTPVQGMKLRRVVEKFPNTTAVPESGFGNGK